MTTEYRDKQGNVIRTDPGTQPRGSKPAKPAAPAPSLEPRPAADPSPASNNKAAPTAPTEK